jgi:hypothetical protein
MIENISIRKLKFLLSGLMSSVEAILRQSSISVNIVQQHPTAATNVGRINSTTANCNFLLLANQTGGLPA